MMRYVTLVLALCFFARPALAQFDSATVSGVVQDGTGGVLPGVDVTLTSVGTGQERRTVSNDTGLYTFPNVPVGTYTVKATLTGLSIPPVITGSIPVPSGRARKMCDARVVNDLPPGSA